MAEKSNKSGEPTDELLDHEYDGIREYDNPLPRWWVWTFWGSFWFAGFYFLNLHVYEKADTVEQEYEAEMAAHREKQMAAMGELSEEMLTKLMQDKAMMADTTGIFKERCEECHADKGQGQIGPNLTDDHWIHGKGSLMDIYKVVNEGAPNGMPAWGRQLRPQEVLKLTAYVGKMRGTNLPGKAPEGNKVDLAPTNTPAKPDDKPAKEPEKDEGAKPENKTGAASNTDDTVPATDVK